MNTENEEIEEHEPYYAKKPEFKEEGTSKLRQHFSKGMSYILVMVELLLLLKSTFKS